MSYTWPPTVAEAKTHLNKGSAVDDLELAGFLDAAVAIVEGITGPIASASFTEWLDGGQETVCPMRLPVVSVTSVTEYVGSTANALTVAADPSAATSYSVTVDPVTGTITRRVGGGYVYTFAPGNKNIKVVYTAGYASAPANVRLAALEQTRHMWDTQRGRSNSAPGYDDGATNPDAGYAVPNRVLELLDRNRILPGMA